MRLQCGGQNFRRTCLCHYQVCKDLHLLYDGSYKNTPNCRALQVRLSLQSTPITLLHRSRDDVRNSTSAKNQYMEGNWLDQQSLDFFQKNHSFLIVKFDPSDRTAAIYYFKMRYKTLITERDEWVSGLPTQLPLFSYIHG